MKYKGKRKGQDNTINTKIIKDKNKFSGVGVEESLKNFNQFLAK